MPTGVRPRLGLPRLGGLWRPRLRGALLLGGIGQGIQVAIPFTMIPLFATDQLHLGVPALGAALSALAVTNISAMSLSGRIGDRYGRLRALLPTLAWGAAVLWLTAHVAGLPLFVACCAATGVAVGGILTVPAAMVVDLATDRTAAIAGYRICADVGQLAGAAAAGALVAAAGGPAALEIAGLALLAVGALALRVGETRSSPSLPSPLTREGVLEEVVT
jgi:MFS family permease